MRAASPIPRASTAAETATTTTIGTESENEMLIKTLNKEIERFMAWEKEHELHKS